MKIFRIFAFPILFYSIQDDVFVDSRAANWLTPGFSPGFGTGFGPGFGAGSSPGFGAGSNPWFGTAFAPFFPNVTNFLSPDKDSPAWNGFPSVQNGQNPTFPWENAGMLNKAPVTKNFGPANLPSQTGADVVPPTTNISETSSSNLVTPKAVAADNPLQNGSPETGGDSFSSADYSAPPPPSSPPQVGTPAEQSVPLQSSYSGGVSAPPTDNNGNQIGGGGGGSPDNEGLGAATTVASTQSNSSETRTTRPNVNGGVTLITAEDYYDSQLPPAQIGGTAPDSFGNFEDCDYDNDTGQQLTPMENPPPLILNNSFAPDDVYQNF